MIRLLLSLIICLFLTEGLTQPSLTADNMPLQGAIFKYVQADTAGYDPGPSGANVTWDFSGLSLLNDTNTFYIHDPASTPAGAAFPGAGYAEQTANEYKYFSFDNDGLYLHGVVFDPLGPVPFDSTVTVASFPFTFGDMVHDTITASFDYLGIITAYRKGSATSEADGYGTLILPNGTYPNTLRVRTTEMSKDSASGLGLTTETESYSWYNEAWDYPVMSMLDTHVEGLFNNDIRLVQFLSTTSLSLDWQLDAADIHFQLFPNPAANHLNISFDWARDTHWKVAIYNTEGRAYGMHEFRSAAGKANANVQIDRLPPGAYFLILDVEGQKLAKAFAKE